MQVTIQKTARYFITPSAAPRIFAMNDSIKLILILRDPVKRLISDYDHEARYINGSRNGPYITIESTSPLENLAFTSAGDLNIAYDAVIASMYDLHLERWFRYFSREQILVLDGEKFKKDPLSILRQCEDFLGLPNVINESMLVFDKEKQLYCRKDTGCLPDKGYKHKTYPKMLVSKLYQQFTPHMKRTFAMIGQNFERGRASII